jgi:mercuric ion transport protein
MEITLIWEKDDEQLKTARQMLRQALVALSILPAWNEWQIGSAAFPLHLKKYQKLTILVNGHLIYAQNSDSVASQTVEDWKVKIQAALQKRPHTSLKQKIYFLISILPALFLAIVPKCPFCWAAYMTAFASLGLPTFAFPKWMLPFFAVLLAINLYILGRLAYYQKKYIPLVFNLLGIACIGIGKFIWNNNLWIWLGVLFILAASIWHSRVIRFQRLNIGT